MLISPPFLSTTQGNDESDEAYVARNMAGGTPGNGAFPVSFNFQWHAGLHVEGPMAPVRAIADGKIKYVRQATPKTNDDVPLNYHAGWTSDGVVVIEHKTEIGENVEVTYYSVYQHLSLINNSISKGKSVYRKNDLGRAGYIYGEPNKFHFEICCDDANLEKLIGRKSGKLDISKDGRTDALWGDMHFALPVGTPVYSLDMRTAEHELSANKDAAKKAAEAADKAEAKRAAAQQAATAAAQSSDAAPTNATLKAHKNKAAAAAEKAKHEAETARAKAKAAQDKADAYDKALATPTYKTDKPLFVGMHFGQVDGSLPGIKAGAKSAQDTADKAAEKKAAAHQAAIEAAQASANKPNDAALLAKKKHAAKVAEHAEHEATAAQGKADLVRSGRGNCLMTTYEESGKVVGLSVDPIMQYEYHLYEQAQTHYPASPSAGYELLRFGRVVGPDALNPTAAKHWRKISYPGGEGWVNLRPDAIKKFSDADFPHWCGWTLADDDTNGDSRCDSATVKNLVLYEGDQCFEEKTANDRLKLASVQTKLKRAICKIPSEWDSSDLDKHWGWLKPNSPGGQGPLQKIDSTLKTEEDFAKLKAHLTALSFWDKAGMGKQPYWYFNPKEFITVFKRCGWLSKNELIQMFPKTMKRLHGTSFTTGNVGGNPIISKRVDRWRVHLNVVLRKYNIDLPQRRLHFFSNVWEETGYLQLMVEGGGASASYAPWWGRGLIQLTHLANYQRYGKYRGFPHTVNTGAYAPLGWNPDILIAQNDRNCIDTAVYWVDPSAVATHHNALVDADAGIAISNLMQTARGTNGNVAPENLNGLDGRLQVAIYLKYVLLDWIRTSNTESLTFTWRESTQKTGIKVISGQVKHIFVPTNHTIDIDISARYPTP